MTVSGLRKSSHWPVADSAPAAQPAANPPLAGRSMIFVPPAARAAATAPSPDALSTTITSMPMPGAAWPTALRQAPMSASLR
jgi:hypothetical protein